VLLTAAAGYGKTTILEEALSQTGRPTAWISCSDAERAPGILLMRILDAIARAAPGASDALAERLASAPQQIDTVAATRALLAELPRLLVELLVLVLDDAEHLDGADDAQRLLGELVSAESSPLRVAVAAAGRSSCASPSRARHAPDEFCDSSSVRLRIAMPGQDTVAARISHYGAEWHMKSGPFLSGKRVYAEVLAYHLPARPVECLGARTRAVTAP
jgi:hypothetical protein